MNLKDVIKTYPLRQRISIKLGSLWLRIRMKVGLCPHDSSFGAVGEKSHMCMCGKEVENEDWRMERKALKKHEAKYKLKKHN